MRIVAAVATASALATLIGPASPAAARATKHTRAHVHCTAAPGGHGAKRQHSHRCVVRHRSRARFAIVNPFHKAPVPGHRNSTPRGHFKPPTPGPRTPGPTAVHCDMFASPTGSDTQGDGTVGRPYSTLVKLDDELAPGQTGCLRGGTYGNTGSSHDLVHSGTPSGQITITAYPGESPTVIGWIGMEGAYTTVSHLSIDGSNTRHQASGRAGCSNVSAEGLSIDGHNDVFEYNNYFQSVPSLRSVGLGLGWNGSPDNTTIRFNKIHDVGGCQAYDHLIYLSHGNNVQIYDNWLWNDPHGWGVQLYPSPTNARVWGNVIDAAGSGFTVGDEQGGTTSGNQIFNNVVMNSTGLPNAGLSKGVAISDYWGGSRGQSNTFSDNLSFDNPGGVARVSNVTVTGTTTADPRFVDAPRHDYNLLAGSTATRWSLWNGSAS
jgi:hypothetical protein